MTPDWLRSAAYRGGALGLRQRLMQRQTLTVAMFHRVAAAGSQAARHADPIYTLSADLFAAVLRFAARHYAVVSLEQAVARVGCCEVQQLVGLAVARQSFQAELSYYDLPAGRLSRFVLAPVRRRVTRGMVTRA